MPQYYNPEYKHGNFLIGASNNSLTHNNIMKKPTGTAMECKGCNNQGLQAYYSRASGSTCPCVGNKESYTSWFSAGNCQGCKK